MYLIIEKINLWIGIASAVGVAGFGGFWYIYNQFSKYRKAKSAEIEASEKKALAREKQFETLFYETNDKYINALSEIMALHESDVESNNLLVFVKQDCPDCFQKAKLRYEARTDVGESD